MATLAPNAIDGEFVRLAHAGLALHEYAREGMRLLRRVVAFDAVAAVWFDPKAGLPVDSMVDGDPQPPETELDRFTELAASGRRATRLSEAGDELWTVDVGDSGLRGGMVLYRRPGARRFTARDEHVLASLGGECAEVQRVRLEQDLSADGGDGDRGLLVLDDEDGIEMADAAATGWLDELGANGRLPLAVTAVAGRARAIAASATVRARTPSGRWVLVRGSALGDGIAVTLEPARAPELAEVIADAYGLTARERRVTGLVAQGLPNVAIAGRLFLSPYTVQDHLKAIFEKLEVSSRGQLVAKLFVDHSVSSARPTAHG